MTDFVREYGSVMPPLGVFLYAMYMIVWSLR